MSRVSADGRMTPTRALGPKCSDHLLAISGARARLPQPEGRSARGAHAGAARPHHVLELQNPRARLRPTYKVLLRSTRYRTSNRMRAHLGEDEDMNRGQLTHPPRLARLAYIHAYVSLRFL